MKQRIKWIDVARALGIFAIYVGHIPITDTGATAVPFVWTFHVPLFFFISGCTEALSQESNLLRYVLKKIKSILIPWLCFSLLALAVHVIKNGCAISEVNYYLNVIQYGNIRNRFLAGALWFLTCLFVVQILFFIISKLKLRWLILVASVAICICSDIFYGPTMPSKPFNFDSALYFQIYYALGYMSFQYLNKLLNSKSCTGKSVLVVSGIVVLHYAFQRFYGTDIFERFYSIAYVGVLFEVFATMVLIWLVILISKLMEGIGLFQSVGSNTLYLCGSEYLVTTLVTSVVGLFGASITVSNGLSAIIYAALLLMLAQKFLVPVEKRFLNTVWKIPDFLKANNVS